MPGIGIGVYPGQGTAGDEISSTYEGRHLTVLESELIHPNHADDLVDKGDPVIVALTGAHPHATYGRAVGVALASAVAATDLIAIDTEGIWMLDCWGYTDGPVGSAIQPGDPLFIHDDSLNAVGANGLGDALISEIRTVTTQIPFGYALGTLVATGQGRIAVKVHWDPSRDTEIAKWNRVTPGNYGEAMYTDMAAPASEGLSKYFQGTLSGTCAGHVYNVGSWINMAAGYASAVGQIHVPFEGGLWSAGANATLRAVFGAQFQEVLNAAPNTLFCWRLNTDHAITALIQGVNPNSVGFAIGEAHVGGVTGTIRFVEVSGAVRYIDVYDGSA